MTTDPKEALKQALLAPEFVVRWDDDGHPLGGTLDTFEANAIVDAIEALIREAVEKPNVADSAAGAVYTGARDVLAEALSSQFPWVSFRPIQVADKLLKKLEAEGYAFVRLSRP